MRKYSLVQENYDLGKISITTNQFYEYKSFIDGLLNDLYDPSKRVNIEGLGLFISALPCEKVDGREYSILNKVNTNVSVLKYLVRKLDPIDFGNLKYIITQNKEDLFFEDGKYFQDIRKIIKNTESVGERNEIMMMDHIKTVVKNKFNVDVEISRNPTSSYKDLILGVDIEFNLDGKEYTCQVKPLVSFKEVGEHIIVESSGSLKQYKTNYIGFVNYSKGSVLLFQNKEISISGKILTIPKKFLVQ